MTRNAFIRLGMGVGALALLGFATSIVAAPPTSKKTAMVYGVIYDEGLRVVPNATLELRDFNSRKVVAKDVTDDRGMFKFTDLPEGSYMLVAYQRSVGSASITFKLRYDEVKAVRLILSSTGK